MKTPEQIKETKRKYATKRRQDPVYREKQRVFYKEWYKKNGRKRKKDYALVIDEWRKSNPEAVKASYLLRDAIRKGELIRPDVCSKCNKTGYIVAHHHDYKQPLNITWLCVSCHKLIHSKLKG